MGRDQAGGRMGRWRVEKQGMSCKALSTWVGERHDEKDGRKGGHSHSYPLTALFLTAQLNATENKLIFRKPSTAPSESQALSTHLQSNAETAWLGGHSCWSKDSPCILASSCPTSLS